VPTPVVSARRRDNRIYAAEVALPAAQPVQGARASTSASAGRRRIAPWLLVSIAALVIVGVITAGALSLGLRDDTALTASGAEAISGRDAMSAQCVPLALSESGERSDRCSAMSDRDEVSQQAPYAPAVETVDDQDVDSVEGPPGSPPALRGTTPDAPGSSNPSTATPGADTPGVPAAPGPVPAPAPAAPAPAPGPAPAPAPQSLAFTGISENHVIGLLGIRILSSYTLSLSGQPGATASASYGASRAGSVTFDSGGRASISLGGALLSAGLDNPMIRVAYSDGTAGSAIQAPRDSI